jgi:putative heme-binding domain-containing protein
LQISLVASEPLISQPLSISFDDRGRLWVLQYIQYPIPEGLKAVKVDQYLRTQYDKLPEPPPRGSRGHDKISILEDTDGDGRMDAAQDFLTGLNLASGMALGHGGVFVVQSPYLLFYADANSDDLPDGDPEVLLTGFGMDDAHAFANSLTWGPDGWLYGAQGSTVTARIRGIEFQQGVWRYHPRTKEFELFAEGGGNTWGVDFDRFGNLFAAGNEAEPMCYHVQGAYYVKGFGKHGPLHNPYSFGYFQPVKHHGYLGDSLSGGFVIYQGGAFPERFNNACIAPHTRHSATRSCTIELRGTTFATRHQGDFITTTDVWFRPIDSLVGPDGALYVCDWYDYNISHSNPKDRSQWYMPSINDGRIWRVSSKEHKSWRLDRPLRELSSDKLIEFFSHPNDWYARQARLILDERNDASVVSSLNELALTQTDQRLALEGLWSLYVTGAFDDELADQMLASPHEYVRAWTIRLLGDSRKVSPALLKRFEALAQSDSSVIVRCQLACTCKRLPGADSLPVIANLLKRSEDASDPQMPLLLWWAIEDKAILQRDDVLKLLGEKSTWSLPLVRDTILERLARRFVAEGGHEGFAACARLLNQAPGREFVDILIRGMETQLAGQHLEALPAELQQPLDELLRDKTSTSRSLIRLALRMGHPAAFNLACHRVSEIQTPQGERSALLTALGEVRDPQTVKFLLALLERGQPEPTALALLAALENFHDDLIGERVLRLYASMSADVSKRAVDLLTRRKNWSKMLLDAVDAEKIAAKDVSADQLRQILLHGDADLTSRIDKRWGSIRASTPRETAGRILAVSQIVQKGTGTLGHGKPLFAKHCATCHQLFGEGNKVGPDLTGAERKNLDALLANVIDPSSVVRQEFRSYIAVTTDGRIFTGLLADSTDETVTILDAKNQRTVLRREDIEELKASDVSLMPEKILDPLSDEDLRDLFAYLRSENSLAGSGK